MEFFRYLSFHKMCQMFDFSYMIMGEFFYFLSADIAALVFWLVQEMQHNYSHVPLQTKPTSEIPHKLLGVLPHQQSLKTHDREGLSLALSAGVLRNTSFCHIQSELVWVQDVTLVYLHLQIYIFWECR